MIILKPVIGRHKFVTNFEACDWSNQNLPASNLAEDCQPHIFLASRLWRLNLNSWVSLQNKPKLCYKPLHNVYQMPEHVNYILEGRYNNDGHIDINLVLIMWGNSSYEGNHIFVIRWRLRLTKAKYLGHIFPFSPHIKIKLPAHFMRFHSVLDSFQCLTDRLNYGITYESIVNHFRVRTQIEGNAL